MFVIKVGLGQSPSGKILDWATQYYSDYDEIKDAIEYARKTGKPMFISFNKRKYRPITEEKLLKLASE